MNVCKTYAANICSKNDNENRQFHPLGLPCTISNFIIANEQKGQGYNLNRKHKFYSRASNETGIDRLETRRDYYAYVLYIIRVHKVQKQTRKCADI